MSQLFLLTYDVACDRRRAKLHALLEQYGAPMQKSVFEARLSAKEEREVTARARKIIDETEDQLLLYRISAGEERKIKCLGRPRAPVEDVTYFLI